MTTKWQHHALIRWNPTSCFGSEDRFIFDTKEQLDAFMQGLAAASDNGTVDYETVEDSREDLPAPVTHWTVRFYKDVTTRDQHSITVRADTPDEARNKVAEWGLTGDGLTDAEEATETLLKEGEVVEGRFYGLEDHTEFLAVMAADAD